MKRLIFFSMMCLMALTVGAQRCAVLEFKAGVGISQNDVDGISAIFITYFRPQGYTMVERSQIDKVIEEQGFQRSSLTQQQMVRIGQILNVSKIVVGDVNVVMGQYNVDARVVSVETGTISATEGTTFMRSDYRTSMQNLSTKLASKIAIKPGSTVPPAETEPVSEFVDLGLPSGTMWKKSNEKGGFITYDEAVSRYGNSLPSSEQWAELQGMCNWSWTGKGYKVTGMNGNSIFLPAAGYRHCDGSVYSVGEGGYYWSSTASVSEQAMYLGFYSGGVDLYSYSRCSGDSVRLVQD